MQPEAEVIVLGQAGGIEHAVGLRRRQRLQGAACVTGANSVGGDETAQSRAHRNILGLKLGELVAVDTVRKPVAGCGQGQHRNLYHVVPVGIVIDPAQALRMDNVFRVMGDDQVETAAAGLFVGQHALVDPVQAVRLGGGAVVRNDGQMHIGIPGLCRTHRIQRLRIVDIGAHKEVIVRVANGLDIVLQHLGDHGMLLPQGHEHGDSLLRQPTLRPPRGRGRVIDTADAALEPAPGQRHVQHKIVQAADHCSDRQRHQARGYTGVEGSHSGK